MIKRIAPAPIDPEALADVRARRALVAKVLESAVSYQLRWLWDRRLIKPERKGDGIYHDMNMRIAPLPTADEVCRRTAAVAAEGNGQ